MIEADAEGLAEAAARGGWRVFDRAAAVVIVALPLLDLLAKALLGGMGWAFLGLFVFLGLAWLVWYAVLLVVTVLLWRRRGVFGPGERLGRWLVLGSVGVQLGLFTALCWLISDASDDEDWQSALGRLLGLGSSEDRKIFGRVTRQVMDRGVPAIFFAFAFMLVVMLIVWRRAAARRRRGSEQARG